MNFSKYNANHDDAQHTTEIVGDAIQKEVSNHLLFKQWGDDATGNKAEDIEIYWDFTKGNVVGFVSRGEADEYYP